MKTNTSAHNPPTFRPDEELVLRARHAIERAITNLSVIRSEPDAGDVTSGERSAWLLDDLLTVRLQLELLDDAPELQGGTAHPVKPCPDCSKPLGTDRACAFCVSSALRNQTPEPEMADAVPQPKTGSSAVSEQPKTASHPARGCDHRDADDYLAKGEEALATCLEVDGQEFVDDESGALLSRSLTRAWSAVRMARLELRGSKGGDQ